MMNDIAIVESEIENLYKALKQFISEGKDPIRQLEHDVLLNKEAHPYNKMLVMSAILRLRREYKR